MGATFHNALRRSFNVARRGFNVIRCARFRYLSFRTSLVVRESSIGDKELEGKRTC